MKSFIIGGTASLAIVAATGAWSAGQAQAQQQKSWHFDPAWIDKSVNPGDSFFQYAQGNWVKNTEIPADKASYSSFHELQDRTNEQLRVLLQDAAAAKAPRGSVKQKVGDYYTAFMDEAAIEARGLAPLKPDFDAINAIRSKADVARSFGSAALNNIYAPLSLYVGADSRDSTRHTVYLGQSGLGLPSRDYYIDEQNPRFAGIRDAYRKHVADMLRMAGYSEPEARAQRIYDLEHKLARSHWPIVDSRDTEKTYNPKKLADLAREMPGFDWAAYLDTVGIPAGSTIIVAQPSAIASAAKLVASESNEAWKDYFTFRTLSRFSEVLPKRFAEEDFRFYGTTLGGTPKMGDRWKRALQSANGDIGQAVGQLYVERHFPPAAKAKMDELVRNLIKAMDNRLANLSWMEPETKVKARAKLAAFNPMIGYPDQWRDYSTLEIKPDDAFGNVRRAVRFNTQRILGRLGKPVDRNEWSMNPQLVNAYANPSLNQIVFPAAHLQTPFFDPDADEAVNYGGIGIGIGHEISHHFDDQGRKFDAQGNVSDWWSPKDVERFKTLSAPLVAQYSAYEPLPGLKVNGQQTLGENLADLAGLAIAYDAYKIALGGKPAPVIKGFTGDQRFFLGFTQVWRAKHREAVLQQQLKAGVHTPSHLRSNTVRNFDAWYDAFNVKDGALYLPPEQRIKIW